MALILQVIAWLLSATALDAEGGKGGEGGEGGFQPPPEEGRKYMSDLIDERIDAAFERWLEKSKEGGGAGASPGGEGGSSGGEGGSSSTETTPAAPAKVGILDFIFGAPSSRERKAS